MTFLEVKLKCNLFIDDVAWKGNPLTGTADAIGKEARDTLAAISHKTSALVLVDPEVITLSSEDKLMIERGNLTNVAFVLKHLSLINKYAEVGMPHLDR
jgi:hypothetical protein